MHSCLFFWFFRKAFFVMLFFSACLCKCACADDKTPNIVLIFIDDMGYADIGPFGATNYSTPNLDRMASEGRRFTNFIVSSAVCSASRAALMTGCIHERVGISGAFGPTSPHGIAASETTLAEICKSKGYATACFGKWHLGRAERFLPTNHGFDKYLGLPYSNDMWPYHPEELARKATGKATKSNYPPLPLIENLSVVDNEVTGEEQSHLTTEYTKRSVDFIRENQNTPFFLYLPHTMVHVPLYVSEKHNNKSGAGLFADVVQEIDWSVGQIFDVLRELKLAENTLVIFTSDNGPWLSYGDHAGSALPLREGKGTAWEGGVRVPTLMHWPNNIPANSTCSQLASTIDILPTVAGIINAKLPDIKIDGKDVRSLMVDHESPSPHVSFPYYYAKNELQAVRDSRWKLVLPHKYRSLQGNTGGSGGIPSNYKLVDAGLELYDLESDPSETKNVVASFPQVVLRLQAEAKKWRLELGDRLTGVEGSEIRPADRAN
ncbi:MAG: sulfatase [Planctomycetota bacterium]|nr:sulfatase [Planctomycetota bacterium]